MVSRTGIEPVTCRLGGGRSILLSYRDMCCQASMHQHSAHRASSVHSSHAE